MAFMGPESRWPWWQIRVQMALNSRATHQITNGVFWDSGGGKWLWLWIRKEKVWKPRASRPLYIGGPGGLWSPQVTCSVT